MGIRHRKSIPFVICIWQKAKEMLLLSVGRLFIWSKVWRTRCLHLSGRILKKVSHIKTWFNERGQLAFTCSLRDQVINIMVLCTTHKLNIKFNFGPLHTRAKRIPWPWNCESPEESVQRPSSQHTSKIMLCGHGPSSVVCKSYVIRPLNHMLFQWIYIHAGPHAW